MSALEDLLEEVRAEAKNAALTEYENEITRLRNEVEQLNAELDRTYHSNARWKAAFEASEQRQRDMLDAIETAIESFDGR